MHESHYIIELSARYFNLSAREMCLGKKIKTALKCRKVAFILLHKYCALEPYKIAPIFNKAEGTVKYAISESATDIVVHKAVKEIGDKYLSVNILTNAL